MRKLRLYTGKELAERGVTKGEGGVPARGFKEVVPTRTWLEEKQIQNSLEERKNMLCERIEKFGTLSQAEWIPEKNLVKYVDRRGGYQQFFGFPDNEQYYLYPEEALHLMEMNCLLLRFNEVTVSFQQAYSLLLNGTVTVDEFRVYSFLCKKGFKLLRHKSVEKNNLSDYEKSINIQPIEKSRAFYKKVYSGLNNAGSDDKVLENHTNREGNDWRTLPLAVVGEVTQVETQESPKKRNKVITNGSDHVNKDMEDDDLRIVYVDKHPTDVSLTQLSPAKRRKIISNGTDNVDKDEDLCIISVDDSNVINVDDNIVISVDDADNVSERNLDADDCIIVRPKDTDPDCVPVETEPSVTMPNIYHREEILIVSPSEKLLPPNIQPSKASYKIDLRALSRRSPVKRNYGNANNRNQITQSYSNVIIHGRRQFLNRSYNLFANHMFRHILKRQAFMANFWPPTFRHNCNPNVAFSNNSRSIFAPFLHNPHVSLYPQITGNTFQNSLNSMISSPNIQPITNETVRNGDSIEPVIESDNNSTSPDHRLYYNRQLEAIKSLISKFDLLKSNGAAETTLENVKTAIDNLLLKISESYGVNHSIESLRNSESFARPNVVSLSSDSEDDIENNDTNANNGKSHSYSKSKRRKRNDIKANKDKCNNNEPLTVINLNEPSENSSSNRMDTQDDSNDNTASSTACLTNSSFSNNWLSNGETWRTDRSFARSPRQSSVLYSEYLLAFTRKSKNVSINTWKKAKTAFEESLSKNTICISDDEDDQNSASPKPVVFSLKVDKVKPLIRAQDCKSASTILQRLNIVKKADIGENLKDLQIEKSKYKIDFDVYAPTAKNIKKENLTKPLFRVVCRRVSDPMPSLLNVTVLLQECRDGVPLKWAVVGPSSITIMQFANVDLPVHCRDANDE